MPVPLPTYVSKPVAPRRAAPIEMDDATRATPATGATGSGEAPQPAATAPPASTAGLARLLDDAAVAEDELDAIITRRAVND